VDFGRTARKRERLIYSNQNTESGESNTQGLGGSARAPGGPGTPGRPYWLLVKDDPRGGGQNSIFTTGSEEEKVLPIFSSREESELFLGSRTGRGYRAREVWAGELLSLLSGSAYSAGPCGGVEKVALDPSPLDPEAEGKSYWMDRQCFMEHLMGRGRPWFQSAG
jgi:hypothetical protein